MHLKTQEFFNRLSRGEKASAILLSLEVTPEEMATIKAEVTAEIRTISTKAKDPEVLRLEAEIEAFKTNPLVAQFLETMDALKKKRGRKVNPDLPKYRHSADYMVVELQDGELVDTEQKGWTKVMLSKGYSTGQVAMVSKGKRGAQNGEKFPNTLTTK